MKLIIILTACVALSASHSLPNPESPPLDNSHYVEGESRYIWMPDADGAPELVDLYAPLDEEVLRSAKNGADNTYALFTRRNAQVRHMLVHNTESTIWNSNYNRNVPTNVVVHGLNNHGGSLNNLRDAFLAAQDCNVIMVDWSRLASSGYPTAVSGVPSVGQHLGNFLNWLINRTSGSWNNVHLVGYSLGAHISAVAGRRANSLPRRITGLDPAGPTWLGNSNRLQPNAGQYVEAIHTDGRILGIFYPSGHADFYPNGGTHRQPGCGVADSVCSHGRAPLFFESTVRRNRLIGDRCFDLVSAENGRCSFGAIADRVNMGNAFLSKRRPCTNNMCFYHLRTSSSSPWEL